MAHQQQQQQQTFLSSVKCEPRLDYRQHYAEATTTSSPWPSSPPMPDLVGGNPAHRAATAAGFLSSSMNFLAHVVTDSSGAAPSELYKLRPRDADTVQSLVSVLATTPASAAAGGRSPSPAPVVGALTHHHHHHHHAPTIPPAVEATPGLATTAHQFLATSSASCPVRPRALKRSKGSGPLAKSSSTTIPAPDMMTQPQHHHHHHHVQPSHPHHHYVAPHLSSSPSSASSSPPSPYAYSRPCPHSGLAAPSVLPVAPCQHHHQQLQQQHSPHPLHHHHHHHQHYPAPGMWLDQHQQHYQFYASHPPVPHHHPHHSQHSHHHGPHHQYYEAHSRPLFWSSSPGVVTRPTQTTPTTSRVASAELPAIPTVTSPASSASPTFAMQRKRRRSQSAPAPRDQLIVPALKIEEVEDNESSTNGGGNAFCSSPMAMSPLRPCSSSPPTSPSSQEALSPTKRSDIYGLLN